jgi:uncharacterized phage protein gp47/JayE
LTVAAPVIAESYGQAANVTAGAICEIVTPAAGVDGVTNTADWLTGEGADEEDDAGLRRRYVLRWQSISGLGKYFYESLAMSVPGVLAVKIDDRHPRGQGTVDVYVKGAAGLPTQNLLAQVTAVIEADKPQIDDFLVKAPAPVPVTVDIVLRLTAGEAAATSLAVENRLRAMFQRPAKDLGVEPLQIGGDLPRARIIYEALKTAGVKDVFFNSPGADVTVPPGGLAVLESLTIACEAADE